MSTHGVEVNRDAVRKGNRPALHLVPEDLLPETTDESLPTLTTEHLRYLQAAGWSRIGILAAVINSKRQILMLEHAISGKNLEGALGPLAETTRVWNHAKGVWHIEQPLTTLRRSFQEELGVPDPQRLGLRARRVGAWTLSFWPSGNGGNESFGFAICPVISVPDESAAQVSGLVNTKEVRGAEFMGLDEIRATGNLRPGTQEWLDRLVVSGLLENPEEFSPISFNQPVFSKGMDAELSDLDL